MSFQTISPVDLSQKQAKDQNLTLIDVRTPAEYREIHVPFAKLEPLDQLNKESVERLRSNGETVYVICKSGSRSKTACQKIQSFGIEDVVMVEGGTEAWAQAGLEVERGKKSFPLERQVQITVGFFVLTGTSLGYFVNPYFLAIPAFFGAGLLFAGLSGFCGLAIVLGKMPWNR